jgi:signal transduction histidine kinase
MNAVTAENYTAIVSQRVAAERLTLASRWLEQLQTLLTVTANEVFPSNQLLDHIPLLINQIADYLRAPADEEIAANTGVIEKARELGLLRHRQRASVHQLLREYEILGDILEQFVVDETARLGLQPTAAECFDLLRRLTHSAQTLMRTTVDTFVSAYTDEIEQRNEQIRSFNRMVSHELRSPIGTLLFAAAVLQIDGVSTDPARLAKVTTTIRSNAERLSLLVQNLQRLTQMTETVDAVTEQVIDLGSMAAEVARQLQDMADARGVDIRIGGDLPSVRSDPARVELVLINLVSNGIKYSDASKPTSYVEITAETNCGGPAEDRACVLAVRDNGLGIATDAQAGVFDRFVRAHAHLDSELGVTGAGLGLSIVSDCVHALGGSIRLESEPGQGSTFFISLPALARSVPTV